MAFRPVRRLKMLLFALLARDYRSENRMLKLQIEHQSSRESQQECSPYRIFFLALPIGK
jgi:hypothetical protein